MKNSSENSIFSAIYLSIYKESFESISYLREPEKNENNNWPHIIKSNTYKYSKGSLAKTSP
jgi:hypothetical protein